MCSGMGNENKEGRRQDVYSLLEFSAADDVIGFKDAVENVGYDVDEVGLWYGRRVGSNKLGYVERTPLMVAAMFGSLNVSAYILGTGRVDVNRRSGSDGATALHCAVVGGSVASAEIVKLLLDASADAGAVDANGKRPVDLVVSVGNSMFDPRKRMLQALLEGTGGADQTCVIFPETIDGVDEYQRQDLNSPRFSKDYPLDLSLPDIKNGIFSTDEFRMYTFKVKPCSRAYSHDWTECPFVHPGENARRRDPKKYLYSCVPCPEFRKGSCSKGDSCDYAHGIFECWLHPAQYRTRLCKDESACTRRVCFFAHRVEELRPLYASTGSAIPSPRSYYSSASALEMGSLSPTALSSPSGLMPPSSTPPLTPSGASSPVSAAAMWQAQSNVSVPTLQLPRSRLNLARTARNVDSDIAMIRAETQRRSQQLMMDEISGLSSPSNWKNSIPNSPSFPVSLNSQTTSELNRFSGVKPNNLEDIFGSLDPSMFHKFHGMSLDAAGTLLQSPTGIQMRPNMNQQNYTSGHSTSSVIGSPTRFDLSGELSAAALNSRAVAFSKRSQSFIERSVANRPSELLSPVNPYAFSNWGSPDGKLDWTIHGEELNKLRKSSSFGFRSSNTPLTTQENNNEPDVSWVNSLVKDATPQESSRFSDENQKRKLQYNLNNGTDTIPAWLEQLYKDQEQAVH
ncbi:zinc finger CCCH domain-containing protein 66-like [Vicia villosa]|uniref:zinc finger CCCH domain-containing protein 66-like n=1 Tax=Vicia villosa TaxID=3911 RepID=UPI00273B184C|nr:zinc finger CCCH domain-containing protein 66-like [Vicia villosa]